MKQYKLDVLAAMEKAAAERHCVYVKTAAEAAGVDRLTANETREVLNAFTKRNPEWKQYQNSDNPLESLFRSAFVSDNESPYEV